MAYVTYVARESLALGHVAEAEYTLPVKLTPNLRRPRKTLKQSQESISGKVEIQYYGRVTTWSVELEPMPLNEALIVVEFLDSTADGQQFEFDPYGSPTFPSAYARAVIREDDGYDEPRVLPRGRGGLDDYVQYSFTVREV
jgi:hypothetical protein